MSNRKAAAWLAGLVIVGALIAGMVPVHTNDISCGAAFSSGDTNAAVAAQFGDDIADATGGINANTTDYAADCADRRSSQRTFVIPLLLGGALGGGFLMLTAKREQSEDQTPRAV